MHQAEPRDIASTQTTLDSITEGNIESRTLILFTIGYERRTLQEFLEILKSKGVTRLVDVREIAHSRKQGFSSSGLCQYLIENEIEYMHFKALGTPKAIRDEYKITRDFSEFTQKYLQYLDKNLEALNDLRVLAADKTTAIMCFERDYSQCHRGIIAMQLMKSGFTIENL